MQLLPSTYILKKSLEPVNEIIPTSALAWYLARLNAPQIRADDSNSNSNSGSILSQHLKSDPLPRSKSPHQEEWTNPNPSTPPLYFLSHIDSKIPNFSLLIGCGIACDIAFEPSVIPFPTATCLLFIYPLFHYHVIGIKQFSFIPSFHFISSQSTH